MAQLTVGLEGFDYLYFVGLFGDRPSWRGAGNATYTSNYKPNDPTLDPRLQVQEATELTYSYTTGYKEILEGEFTHSPQLLGGVLNRYTIVKDDKIVVDFSNFSVPVKESEYGSPLSNGVIFSILGGADSFMGSEAVDVLGGFAGADTIVGGGGGDTLYGDIGDDLLYGNMGEDGIRGYDGADTIFGGKQFDSLWGEVGDDAVNGNMGDDVVVGGEGNDTLNGGQDSDLLWGDAGNDLFYGDKGNDTLRGGAGADMFYLQAEGGTDYIADFNYAEGDRVIVAAGMPYTVGTDNGLHLTLADGSSIYLVGHTSPGSIAGGWIVTG